MRYQYPPWWNQTVTLYNKCTEDGKLRYYRHVISRCALTHTVVTTNDSGNAAEVSENTLRVRKDRRYIAPCAYDAFGSADKAVYFTFRAGDIVFDGVVNAQMEDEPGKRPGDILKQYRGFVVRNAADNSASNIIPHYRAGG